MQSSDLIVLVEPANELILDIESTGLVFHQNTADHEQRVGRHIDSLVSLGRLAFPARTGEQVALVLETLGALTGISKIIGIGIYELTGVKATLGISPARSPLESLIFPIEERLHTPE